MMVIINYSIKQHIAVHSSEVCVCIYSFTVKASSVCNNALDILERYGSTILCCEYYIWCFCHVLSSPFLKMSYFTFKDETPATDKLERKRYDILPQRKMIYIDIGYKSTSLMPTSDEKILKIRRLH